MGFTTNLIIWDCSEFIAEILALFIAYKVNISKSPQITSLLVGCFMISISLTYTTPRAESQTQVTNIKYPYHALISLFVFSALTLFHFIRNAIVLMDHNILIPCDAINIHTTFSNQSETSSSEKKPKFQWRESIIEMIYFVSFFLESSMIGLHYGSLKSIISTGDQVLAIIRFIEYGILGCYFLKCHFSKTAYWIFSIIFSITVPIFSVLGVYVTRVVALKHLYSAASSLMIGIYLYLGSSEIHSAFSNIGTSLIKLIVCVIISLSFAPLIRIIGYTL